MQLAIYSPADRLQPHRYKADESYQVNSTPLCSALKPGTPSMLLFA